MAVTARPININQPVIGRKRTIKIPIPRPIKQTPIVFLNTHFILITPFSPNTFVILYVFCSFMLPYVDYFVSYNSQFSNV